MIKKINRDEVPAEEVNASMVRKIITGERLMIARIKYLGAAEAGLT